MRHCRLASRLAAAAAFAVGWVCRLDLAIFKVITSAEGNSTPICAPFALSYSVTLFLFLGCGGSGEALSKSNRESPGLEVIASLVRSLYIPSC